MKLLFDHTEKCGGTTVLRYLQSAIPSTFVVNGYNTWHAIEHYPAEMECIAGHDAHFLKDIIKPELSAIVLREPVERVSSLYRYLKQESIIGIDWTVEHFIGKAFGAINFYAYKYSGLPGHLFSRCPKVSIARSVEAILSYDRIGFTDDLASFVQSLGLNHPYNGLIANQTTFVEEISFDDLERIRKANLLDIQIYEAVRDHVSKR